ncbi:MAG: hypothetical protein M3198_18580 [Actinomycetota bacterium]|nr:hypothetical protein [Actinomycetota bacterium]
MAELSPEEQEILEALGGRERQGQTLTPSTIGDESGLRVEDVKAALERLHSLGYVAPAAEPEGDVGNTRWSLLPKAREDTTND